MLAAAERIADDVLFPDAERADREALLDRGRFRPLADAGLFGIAGPAEEGFADLDPVTSRRVIAMIGGGCGATFFSWVQHHGVVRTIRASENVTIRSEWLGPLCRGERIAGVAFAHLRRRDRRAITASRVDGGWRLDGTAPWATSWGIADAFAVAAESDAGEVVWSLLPVSRERPWPGVHASPLALPVFASTGTVVLEFDGCTVPDDHVVAVEDAAAWRSTDRVRAALGQPAVLGVADRAIRLLEGASRTVDDPAGHAAAQLGAELDRRWQTDTELLSIELPTPHGEPADELITARSTHRAASLDLCQRACTALLAAVGGAGMGLDHPAQRLAREATFYVIQAQTIDGRAATLRRAVGRSPDDST